MGQLSIAMQNGPQCPYSPAPSVRSPQRAFDTQLEPGAGE